MSEYEVTVSGYEHVTVEAESESEAIEQVKHRAVNIVPNKYRISGPY